MFELNQLSKNNYTKIKITIFILPIFITILILLFLNYNNSLNEVNYLGLQKDLFYFLNKKLGQFPHLQYNITQLGDAFILLSLLTIFIHNAPRLWGVLINGIIVSAIFSKILKELFSVPRPAAFLNPDTFIIIGDPLTSTTSSLPSGHSITVFTILTILMYGFLPKNNLKKFFWITSIVSLSTLVAISRVAVGAHYPLDTIIGSLVGYFCGLFGIFISKKIKTDKYLFDTKNHIFFFILIITSISFLIYKITIENLIIYYITLICLIYTLYAFTKSYIKK